MAAFLRPSRSLWRGVLQLEKQALKQLSVGTVRLNSVADLPEKQQVGSVRTFATGSPLVQLIGRHRQALPLGNKVPKVAVDAWVAPDASVIGDVEVHDRAIVWHGCVLRGDLNKIIIGPYSHLHERTVVHAAATSPTSLSAQTKVGMYVTVGAKCSLRSCVIEDNVVIGERCVLAEGSLVETNAIVGPGSVLPPGRRIPSGELWAGTPVQFVRKLSKDEIAEIKPLAVENYLLSKEHSEEFLPYGSAYIELEKLCAKIDANTKTAVSK